MESQTLIEKKIDLLFRIIMGIEVQGIRPYNENYLSSFMEEIIPLFELDIQEPPNPNKKKPLEQELLTLNELLKSGNYLKKEEDNIVNQKKDLQKKISQINSQIQSFKKNYAKETWIKLFEKVNGNKDHLSHNVKSHLGIPSTNRRRK